MSVSALNQSRFIPKATLSVCLYPWTKSICECSCYESRVDLITMRLTFREGGSQFRPSGSVYVAERTNTERQHCDGTRCCNKAAPTADNLQRTSFPQISRFFPGFSSPDLWSVVHQRKKGIRLMIG